MTNCILFKNNCLFFAKKEGIYLRKWFRKTLPARFCSRNALFLCNLYILVALKSLNFYEINDK